ncbi:enolase-like domain-containing protein [Vibrio penaeicida]|nr:hypothetical protein [Vibrio penaeicida]
MMFKIVDACVSYHEIPFKNGFTLSKGRELLKIRLRNITLTVSFLNGQNITSDASIFDSDLWAKPPHVYGDGDREKNLSYFSHGVEYIFSKIVGRVFSDPIEYEVELISLANAFDNEFCTNYGYLSSEIMRYMLISPFSVSFSVCYKKNVGRTLLSDLLLGELKEKYFPFLSRIFGSDESRELIDFNVESNERLSVPLLNTMDLSVSLVEIKRTLKEQSIRQLKIKIDPSGSSVEKLVNIISIIDSDFPGVKLYLDANQSFSTYEQFWEMFLTPVMNQVPNFNDYVLGYEEVISSPLTSEIDKRLVSNPTIYLDENAGSLESLNKIREMGYGIALKSTRPLGVLAIQIVYCQYHGIDTCIQDLTFSGNTLKSNLLLSTYTNTSIGIESNFGYLVENTEYTDVSLCEWNNIVSSGDVFLAY